MYFCKLPPNSIPDEADDEFVDDSEDFSEDFSTTFVVPFRWWTMAFWEAVDFGCGFDWGFGCDLDWAAFLGTGFLASLSESVLFSENQDDTFNEQKTISFVLRDNIFNVLERSICFCLLYYNIYRHVKTMENPETNYLNERFYTICRMFTKGKCIDRLINKWIINK